MIFAIVVVFFLFSSVRGAGANAGAVAGAVLN
jgi:hypothetical protein